MTQEETDVMGLLQDGSYLQPTQMCRLLNLVEDGKGGYRVRFRSGWCPVFPPNPGQRVACVPRASLDRMMRTLHRLIVAGRVRCVVMFRRRRFYVIKTKES